MAVTTRLKPQFSGRPPCSSSRQRPMRTNFMPRQRTQSTATVVNDGSSNVQVSAGSEGASTSSQAAGSSPAPKKPPLGTLEADLSAIGMVYFVQGIMELATLAQTYHLKDALHADPAQVSLFLSLASVPWSLKPLIGFVSDTVPLWGYRRRSYLLLASLAGCVSYLWMGQGGFSGHGAWGFVGAMLMASTASAVSDVVADSMVVTRAREEAQDSAGSLQSLCWAAYAVGQVLTASLSGSLVQDYGPATVLQLTAMFPLLVGAASLLVTEDKAAATDPVQQPSTTANLGQACNSPRTSLHGAQHPPTFPHDLEDEAMPAYAYATVPLSPSMSRSTVHTPGVFACSVEPAGTSTLGSLDLDSTFPASGAEAAAGTAEAAAAAMPAPSSGARAGRLEQRAHPLFVGSNNPYVTSSMTAGSGGASALGLVATAPGDTAATALGSVASTTAEGFSHGPNLSSSRAAGRASSTTAGQVQTGAQSGISMASVREHTAQLWDALQQPDMRAPLAFLLLLSATPTADSAMFFYQTEQLHFTPGFLGQVQLAAACSSFAGVLLYNGFLKRVRMRDLLLGGTLVGAALQCGQLVLVSGLHRQWGVDDHSLVLGGSVVMDVIQNVLYMPTMVLAARLCPPGLEATMFATIMSLCNLADGVRLAGGAALMSALGVTATDFNHLPQLLLLCNAALLLPLPLLQHIPDKFDRGEEDAGAGETNSAETNTPAMGSMPAAGKGDNGQSTTPASTHTPSGISKPVVFEQVSGWFQSLQRRLQPQAQGPIALSMPRFGSSTGGSSGISAVGGSGSSVGRGSQRMRRAARAAAAKRKQLGLQLLRSFMQPSSHLHLRAAADAAAVAAVKPAAGCTAASVVGRGRVQRQKRHLKRRQVRQKQPAPVLM